MTTDEFKTWLAACCRRFPQVENQFSKAGDGRADLASAWHETLQVFDLHESLLALQRILDGSDVGPTGFEMNLMPRFVADSCRAARRRKADSEAACVITRDTRGKRRMAWEDNTASIKQALVECHHNGGDVAALADELMPIDDDLRTRHRCQHCLDDGMVSVWAKTSIDLACEGRLRAGSMGLYRKSMACSCSAGDRFAKHKDLEFVRFNTDQFCKCHGFSQLDIDQLIAWCGEQSNYEPAFDSYNEGS